MKEHTRFRVALVTALVLAAAALALLAVLLVVGELQELLPGQHRLLIKTDVQILVSQIVKAHSEPRMGLRQQLEPVQRLRLEPADVFLVAAVLVHDTAGTGVTVHGVQIIILEAKAGPKMDARIVHLTALGRISAFLHQDLEHLVVIDLVQDLDVVFRILEMGIASDDPGHVFGDDRHRNAVSACECLDLLATKRDRNAAHHIRRLGPAQEILTEFHEHELVQIFLEVTADAVFSQPDVGLLSRPDDRSRHTHGLHQRLLLFFFSDHILYFSSNYYNARKRSSLSIP